MANNINITFSKADMGLENVDNTSDLNKPISTATQTALDNIDLQSVVTVGNTTDTNIQFGNDVGVLLNNNSKLKEGTIDAGYGGTKGIAQICAVGYELKWEAGRLYVMGDGGTTIREVSHNFTTTPNNYDDLSKGFILGSRWILDNGDIYICTEPKLDEATWELQTIDAVPTDGSVKAVESNGVFDALADKVDKEAGSRLITSAESTLLGNTSGTNTGDETDTTIKTKLGITTLSGSNTGDQDLSGYQVTLTATNLKTLVDTFTTITTPVDADVVPITDSAGTTTKKLSWSNVKSYLLSYFDTIFPRATSDTTGSVITFNVPVVWNTPSSPSSSNLTNDLTNAKIGYIQKIYHNKATAPTVPAGWVLIGTGTYTTSTLNIIFAEWVSGTRVEYWITKPA